MVVVVGELICAGCGDAAVGEDGEGGDADAD